MKMPEMRPGVHFCFSEHIKAFSERFVVAEQRFQELMSAENISRQLSERPSFSFRFASIPNLQGNRHYEVQALRISPAAFDGRVIIVSEEIDDVINAEVQLKMEAEERSREEQNCSELLALHGIACDCAEDGSVCIERFSAAPEAYSAILMDMQMPNMNGIEATEALRRLPLPQAKAIPSIAMTANALSDDVARCIKSGMNDHLSKPVDMPQLLELLSSLLR